MLPATTPRWVPKKVLWVLPVTMSAPSAKGLDTAVEPGTWAMSNIRTARSFQPLTMSATKATGSR